MGFYNNFNNLFNKINYCFFSGLVFTILLNMQVIALASADKVLINKAVPLINYPDSSAEREQLHQCSSIVTDFMVSQAVSVSGALYLEGFANRLESSSAYSNYKKNIAERRELQYISNSEGMLEAYDAKTGSKLFVFTPSLVLSEQAISIDKKTRYKAYVASKPVIADVYDGLRWRTILVGTLGTYGKGLYVLDITDPDTITVLWELDLNSDIFNNLEISLGYSLSEPTVARLHNGKWAVVLGNGYDGKGAEKGAAALYLLDAIDGSLIKSLSVQSDLLQPNGLSAPRLADYDGDGVADYAYAGDFHGNLWRFDLLGDGASGPTLTPPSEGSYGSKNGSSRHFQVSYGGKPLFVATASLNGARQPIIAAPSIVRHPSRIGYLVVFGTGSYIAFDNELTDTAYSHSLYGIWDIQTKAQTTLAELVKREQLTRQSITGKTININHADYIQSEVRTISNSTVEWFTDFDVTQSIKKRGWYMDFEVDGQLDGEMLIDSMHTLGSMLLLQTFVPASAPCSDDSRYWLYAINPVTGGRVLHHVFANHAAENDIVTAIKFGAPGGVSIRQNVEHFFVHADDRKELIALPADSIGRQSWRMVPEP